MVWYGLVIKPDRQLYSNFLTNTKYSFIFFYKYLKIRKIKLK